MANLKFLNNIKTTVDKHKWLTVLLGNILSTMIGIALTIGVTELIQYRNDRKIAREMMFNIVKAAEKNGKLLENCDSSFQEHVRSIDSLVSLYNRNNSSFDNVPSDTLEKYINMICAIQYSLDRLKPMTFMNDSKTLHLFGKADVYADFDTFVQVDNKTFEDVDNLNQQWRSCVSEIVSASQIGNKKSKDILKEMIENKALTKYEFNIKVCMIHEKIVIYKQSKKHLLKVMDATEEEYNEFLESNKASDDTTIQIKHNEKM